MMQVVLSIQAGKVLPSMLLQKLGVYLTFRPNLGVNGRLR